MQLPNLGDILWLVVMPHDAERSHAVKTSILEVRPTANGYNWNCRRIDNNQVYNFVFPRDRLQQTTPITWRMEIDFVVAPMRILQRRPVTPTDEQTEEQKVPRKTRRKGGTEGIRKI